jgi:tetratricopeptide (TPR) repeat protein
VVGDEFRINVHLLDVATARLAGSAKAIARSDRLVGPLDQMVRELLEKLKVKLPPLTVDQIDQSPAAGLHFMRGLGFYFAKMPDDAIAQFMKVLAIDPSHARARFWNGMAYFEQGEYEHARLEFERFVKQHGQDPLAARAKDLLGQCETRHKTPQQGGTP